MAVDNLDSRTSFVRRVAIRSGIVAVTFCQLTLFFSLTARAGELGANKFDLMLQYIPPSAAIPEEADGYQYVRRAMAKKAISDASDAGLAFLRVSVTGYWPVKFGDKLNDLALWQTNPAEFWAALDEMFDDLDRASLRLVPTFVWNLTQFPVLGEDSVTTFLHDPQSRSRHLLAQFIRDFVGRYKDRKTILFYELSNELNLRADVDQRRQCQKYNANNCVLSNFTTAEMIEFSQQIVPLIKSLDPSRLVASGYSIPRRSALHLMRRPEFSSFGADWTPDTKDEFRQYLLAIHEPFDVIEVHIYPEAENNRFERTAGHQYELIADTAVVAKAIHKPLFVGEFGDKYVATPFLINVLDQLVFDHVDYAAIWVWEYYQSATYRTHDTEPTLSSVEPGYSDDLIGMLTKTARRLGGGSPPAQAEARPQVILTWPLPCATIDRPLELAAVASDGSKGVKSVAFLVDGKPIAAVATPPYYAHFDPEGFGQRPIDIEVTALNSSGASAKFKSTVKLNGDNTSCGMPRRQ
jgi:hypothetical protein